MIIIVTLVFKTTFYVNFFCQCKEILTYFISEFKNKSKNSSKNNIFEKNFFVNKTFAVTIFSKICGMINFDQRRSQENSNYSDVDLLI